MASEKQMTMKIIKPTTHNHQTHYAYQCKIHGGSNKDTEAVRLEA
jgi:hypothetical protein